MIPADPVVRARWLARTHAERGSAVAMDLIADRLASRLSGASRVVRAVERVGEDERRHAHLCEGVLTRLGVPVPASTELPSLPLTESGDFLVGLLENVVFLLCAGEAIAVPMLREAAARATAPGIAEVLSEIARDEARHAALGWVALDAVVAELSPEQVREAAQPASRQAVRAVLAARAVGDAGEHGAAWGLIDGERAFVLAKEVLKREVGPQLHARGLWRMG